MLLINCIKNTNSKVIQKLNKYKKIFTPLLKKYTKGDKILFNKIFKDAGEDISESFNRFEQRKYKIGGDFGYRAEKNKKFGFFNFFKKIKNEFKDLLTGDILMDGIFVAAIGFLIWALSMLIYNVTEHTLNGIERGIVVSEIEFEEAHFDFSYTTDGSNNSYKFTEYVPDTWMFEVKDIKSNRMEKWSTTNKDLIDNIEKGDTLSSDDFTWDFTIKK